MMADTARLLLISASFLASSEPSWFEETASPAVPKIGRGSVEPLLSQS